MTKKLFIVCAALVWTVALVAQNISVVAANGSTKLYRTLQAAIEGADPNSVIYLPGGGFPIADSVKITKKLTIIGIGHKSNNENADGVTTISGNLFFNQGSSESAVMGCYVTGNVYVGNDGNEVDDIFVKCCNLKNVTVSNSNCKGTFINQNYIREDARFNGANGRFLNNITHGVGKLNDGIISNNICFCNADGYIYAFTYCNRTSITNNIVLYYNANSSNKIDPTMPIHSGNDCVISGNMTLSDWGDDYINIFKENFKWEDVFEDFKGNSISPAFNFHFKDEYKQYENQVGIYAGDGFNDKQLAPVPYIVAKKIDEQTDTAGKLNIKIRVKASGEE